MTFIVLIWALGMVSLTTHQLVLINQHPITSKYSLCELHDPEPSKNYNISRSWSTQNETWFITRLNYPTFWVVLIITFHQASKQPTTLTFFYSTKLNCNNSHTQTHNCCYCLPRDTFVRLARTTVELELESWANTTRRFIFWIAGIGGEVDRVGWIKLILHHLFSCIVVIIILKYCAVFYGSFLEKRCSGQISFETLYALNKTWFMS